MLLLFRCLQLSQMKDKEEFGGLEDFDDPAGMHVPYAVGNSGSVTERPHSASASDIASLGIVMGSQVLCREGKHRSL